jgi:hypothetical protein
LVGSARLRAADLPFTSRLRVSTAAGREENETYWRPVTASLLVLSSPVRLITDLVNFEPLGGSAVELVAGVLALIKTISRPVFAATTEREKK